MHCTWFNPLNVIVFSCRDEKTKVANFAEETVYGFVDSQYIENFRMKPATIEKLIAEIAPYHREPKGVNKTNDDTVSVSVTLILSVTLH